jgi:hypothetical protein
MSTCQPDYGLSNYKRRAIADSYNVRQATIGGWEHE